MNIISIRSQFPSLELKSNDQPTIFFDNAAGTQVARQSIDRLTQYFLSSNANTGGVFETSLRSDELIETCRQKVADFLGVKDRQEVAFGPNMTTLTQAFARAFGRSCKEGDEIITTSLEHEANISPWLGLAKERGVKVRFVDINLEDMTINLDSLRRQLSNRTRLVAVGYASNAFGTVNPVREVAELAHSVGALCFVDAVHYSPHGLIDVKELGCDVLVYSVYKAFGPHLGVIWGRREIMEGLETFHLRTVKNIIPDKFEVGTQNHEGIAGALGSIEYLETLPKLLGKPENASPNNSLPLAMNGIREYEKTISERLLEVFAKYSKIKVYGITDTKRLNERVPTFAINVEGYSAKEVAKKLAEKSINVWSGNYYALEPMTRLGIEEKGGAVRISLVHYNTFEEIDLLDKALNSL
ncbi:MAG: cysteine desulfurase-like protein [Acidobacteria bacterium]|nr:cysteine desulfurase-like protein [Acidobacteriota bacterium]